MDLVRKSARSVHNDRTYPVFPESLPKTSTRQGRYLLCFAHEASQLERILQLRYQVFNLELGEGLSSSTATGLDRDEFDAGCHHLMVLDHPTGEIVGTYRMQTSQMAASHRGFYSAGEFGLDSLPPAVRQSSVELGRACISQSHRNRQVLFLLWKGLAAYVAHNRHRYLFGCSSLTSQDPVEGLAMLEQLRLRGHVHEELTVPPLPGFECHVEEPPDALPEVPVPSLFRTYLRYGAKVCGPPAIDRAFKTIDFFMLFDLAKLDERRYGLFFGDAPIPD
jgi:putative hemolysin